MQCICGPGGILIVRPRVTLNFKGLGRTRWWRVGADIGDVRVKSPRVRVRQLCKRSYLTPGITRPPARL
jgi:hypothetical protein